jgi:hypothetical protein
MLALVALFTLVANAWIVALPWQLDDFVLVGDPWAMFGHVERLAGDDVPAFMCRIPMWIAWGLVHLVAPEPLSPVPFHVFGLLLHASAAVLLARVVARHAPREHALVAGACAGAVFGAAGGALQAVSWTAAWSSLLYTLFALGALNAALDGRARARWPSAAAAGALLYLAIITKVPALVAAVVVLLALALTAAHARAWRRLGIELAWGAAGIFAGLVTRTLFLGTRHLRYEQRVEPGLADLPAIVAHGFHALGQALYPWNRDPLFHGDAPVLAHLGLAAPWVAVLCLAPLVVAAVALAPRARPALALLALCLVPAVVPPGVIYDGQPTNVVAREAYLPLAVTAAALGIAAAALYARRPRLARVGLALVALLVADGALHVKKTERLHADELRATRALLEHLADGQEAAHPDRELLVLALMPDAGFAGIPSLGRILPKSFAPPFTARRRLDIRPFARTAHLAEFLGEGGAELAARDVVLIGPECDAAFTPLGPDPALPGAENRARRRLRALTPVRPGLRAGASRELALDLGVPAAPVWRAATPLPAHAVAALELDIGEDIPLQGAFGLPTTNGGELLVPFDAPGSSGARLVLGLPADPALRLGPPIAEVAWRSDVQPKALELVALASLPELAPLSPSANAELDLAEHREHPPAFAVRAPGADQRPGSFARLELEFDLLGASASVFHDAPLALDANGVLTLAPDSLHLAGESPTPVAGAAPWRMLPEQRILPTLTAGALNGASFRWRVTLVNAGGSPAARSPYRRARFVLAPESR